MSTASSSVLEVKGLTCSTEHGASIFNGVNLNVNEGDIIILQGKSGCGKTTLLKCIAHLAVYEGKVLFRGRAPKSYGIPSYRINVAYVPQRTSLLPGTPRDFLNTVLRSFKSRREGNSTEGDNAREAVEEVGRAFGIDVELWDREWSNLSGGEAQRISLAIGIGLGTAEILLLDEPTSALDISSTYEVEKYILDQVHNSESSLKAVIWITHSEEQAQRVGTRFVQIEDGKVKEAYSVLPSTIV